MRRDRGRTAVGVGQEDGDEGICAPGVFDDARPEPQGDDAGERPHVLQHGKEGALVLPFRESGDGQQGDDVEDGLERVSLMLQYSAAGWDAAYRGYRQ